MANITVTFADGTPHTYSNVPDNVTPDQIEQRAAHDFAGRKVAHLDRVAEQAVEQPKSSIMSDIGQGIGNLAAGAVRGAGSIGATILAPYDMAKDAIDGKGLSLESNRERRTAMDEGLQSMGAQPDSMMYKGGKIAGEIAGTAGTGGVLAKGVSLAPALAKFAPAIESGGFNLGNAQTSSKLANALTRFGGGAAQGGAQAALANPSSTGTGAVIGGIIPGAAITAGYAGYAGKKLGDVLDATSHKLMQSALKPTIEQLRTGKASTAVQTLLDEGINATKGGVDTLRGRIGDINDQVSSLIGNSTATVSKQKVMDALNDTRQSFSRQVSPTADIGAINGVADDFAIHPLISGDAIPVQLAQQLKQGTYSILSKKYGQVGSAETEAQKALARGLKDGVADAVPEVSALNAHESKLITTLGVTERRALMDANKNPMGLAMLASNPATWAVFMADKSALFKSLAARLANSAASASKNQLVLPELIKNHGLLGAPSVIASGNH